YTSAFPDRCVSYTLTLITAAAPGLLRGDEDPLFRSCAGLDQELRGPNVGRPRTNKRDRDVRYLLAHDLQRVDQPGDVDRRGALLVVMPHRDLAFLPEPLEDGGTLRLRDVFEVHAAERGRDELDRLDDLLRILRRERNRKGVDA